ncbi:TonB-dependent receptor [Sphingomonas sp. LHG3406-1]|uniref:TonB-dependent receptor n=1 Tax=Sphingomonas sp. LHG3406-1 TaxID=2804617 RepID=UPI00261C626D|nr:TonB-dependent receptor [Sphingomonas sp. LHG3406-1]
MAPADAVRLLAAHAGLNVRAVGPKSFVLSPRRLSVLRQVSAPVRQPTPPPRQVRAAPPLPDPAPQDIVVTASKRDTLSRRFPGQWSRIDGDDLALTGARGTEAVEARSVGFASTHLGAGRNKLFIRGIADSSFSGPTQSPVGQYLGDLRTGYAGPDPDLRLVDMNSVEILEGPQGTLYGAGALGGIMLLRPNMPDSRRFGTQASVGLSATEHGEPGYDIAATINAPLGERAALRVTGYRSDEGGYVDNRLTGDRDINDVAVTGGRLIASSELTPGWFADVQLTGQRIRGEDSQYSDDVGEGLSRASLVDLPYSSDFALVSFTLRKDSGDLRVRSTTGFIRQEVDERFDFSSLAEQRVLSQRSRARGFSSETRLWRPKHNGLSWLVGLSLLDHRFAVRRDLAEQGSERRLGGAINHINEVTLYGELGAELNDFIDMTAGARLTETNLTSEGQHLSAFAFQALAAIDPERNERRFLPSASILARPVEGLSLYLRYQQGFRPGGLSIANESVQNYRRDLLATAEAGFRVGTPLVGRFDLAGSVSRSRWRSIQADYLDGAGLPVTANIGDGTIWSATLNGGVRLTSTLRLEGGIAFNDGRVNSPSAELARLLAAAPLPSSGHMRIPNIARVAGRGAIHYRRNIGNGNSLQLNLYGRYVGASRLGIGPRLGERQGDYFDSGLLAKLNGGQRTVTFSLINLTDSVGNRFTFGAPVQTGTDQLTPLRPRTVRVGLEWAF